MCQSIIWKHAWVGACICVEVCMCGRLEWAYAWRHTCEWSCMCENISVHIWKHLNLDASIICGPQGSIHVREHACVASICEFKYLWHIYLFLIPFILMNRMNSWTILVTSIPSVDYIYSQPGWRRCWRVVIQKWMLSTSTGSYQMESKWNTACPPGIICLHQHLNVPMPLRSYLILAIWRNHETGSHGLFSIVILPILFLS